MDKSSTINTDHTTVGFDPETLNPAQLDGRACVVCGTEDGPMKPVDLYVHENGETQLFACSGQTPEQPASSATALQKLRDVLGVDEITGLDLADAVRVGMVLGQMLASDGDVRMVVEDLTDDEHDELRRAVVDVLDRRRGVTVANFAPVVLPYSMEGLCADASCIGCREQVAGGVA
ncbi:hypothetical protein E1292_35225 [Nonomuraea deserti]|uniref:Uncharacterized protein n=1 Tax=Nonomuraea deserti TaxID=1848322 RepID=A0A4R4V9Q1_9ACTN|nr:hypothetical protein [Nonomuraea deserti]TDC98493.1 hypothetical protein E1292_35225 [Nonomuraea deserti]